MDISGLRLQKIWGRSAAINFTLGSAGAAYYIIAAVSWWFLSPSASAPYTVPVTSIAVLAMSAGFIILALESANSLRGLYALLNLRTSWMSREVLLAAIFMVCSLGALVLSSRALALASVIAAFLFIIAQALIVYRARAIISWNTPAVPILFIVSGFVGGFGIYVIFHEASGFSQLFVIAVFIAIVAHLVAWGGYLMWSKRASSDLRRATASLREYRSLALTFIVGGLLPLALIALTTFTEDSKQHHLFFIGAGLAMLFGIYIRNSDLILKAGFFRKLELRVPQNPSSPEPRPHGEPRRPDRGS